jgi:hypothetical protein
VRGGIAFIEYELNDRQHGLESREQFVCFGLFIRNACVTNLAFGAHQPPRHRFCRHQKWARDFIGFQTAEQPYRQRDLRFGRERRIQQVKINRKRSSGFSACHSSASHSTESNSKRPTIPVFRLAWRRGASGQWLCNARFE